MSGPTSKLYLGDCLDMLKRIPDGSVDAVVTDPPYGIGYVGSPGETAPRGIYAGAKVRRTRETVVGDDQPFDPAPWIRFPCAFWGAQHFYDRLPPGGSFHSWDKRGDYQRITFADADFVWISRKRNAQTFRLVWRGLCRHAENRDKILHPTQKPLAVMSWVISLLNLKPGSTILDPYMGSGTTGIAAAQLGFNFIGVEIDPAYFAIAKSRITAARRAARKAS